MDDRTHEEGERSAAKAAGKLAWVVPKITVLGVDEIDRVLKSAPADRADDAARR